MPIAFTKMHGLGNDFVCISAWEQEFDLERAAAWASAICDRRRGVGADGLILITRPAVAADAQMHIFNADGSRAQMCGNGIRCVATLVVQRGWATANPLRVLTDAGIVALEWQLGPGGLVATVRVDMGTPVLDPGRIPVALGGDRVVATPLPLPTHILSMTCVSTGNPHAVIFVDALDEVPLETWGPMIERHPLFPERVNVHFARVDARDHVTMKTWERGSGVTPACGTGACAVCVAGVLNSVTDRQVTATLPGGTLELVWDAADDHIYMTGPAAEVFTGRWPSENAGDKPDAGGDV